MSTWVSCQSLFTVWMLSRFYEVLAFTFGTIPYFELLHLTSLPSGRLFLFFSDTFWAPLVFPGGALIALVCFDKVGLAPVLLR